MPCLVPMLACVNQALRSIADEHLKVVECIRL
jgi:hypothetical protein